MGECQFPALVSTGNWTCYENALLKRPMALRLSFGLSGKESSYRIIKITKIADDIICARMSGSIKARAFKGTYISKCLTLLKDQMFNVLKQIYTEIDSGDIGAAAFLDLKKAFDTCNTYQEGTFYRCE